VKPAILGNATSMIDPRNTAAVAAALAIACASVPPVEPRAECPTPGPRAAPRSAVDTAGDAQRGADLFARECASCHSATFERAPDAPASAPRLDCAEWLAATSDAYLYDAINRGPGTWSHGPLPPFGEQLTPRQISDLVAYLRSLNQANSAPTTRR
jgi:mono/diheme cytochrome c family protein